MMPHQQEVVVRVADESEDKKESGKLWTPGSDETAPESRSGGEPESAEEMSEEELRKRIVFGERGGLGGWCLGYSLPQRGCQGFKGAKLLFGQGEIRALAANRHIL